MFILDIRKYLEQAKDKKKVYVKTCEINKMIYRKKFVALNILKNKRL